MQSGSKSANQLKWEDNYSHLATTLSKETISK